jgi:phage terminase large subunit GpA-like protein
LKPAGGASRFAKRWRKHVLGGWHVPPPMRPSALAEKHRVIQEGSSAITGPYRVDNAPYARGLMDIPTRPGCVRAACMKGARIGWSEVMRNLVLYFALHDVRQVGLVLPSRDEGRKVTKTEILPMFRRTRALRELVGSMGRDTLIESIELLNGFRMGLLWSGSAASTAGKYFPVGIIDEADKTEEWAGDEPDLVGRIESRISTAGDNRLLLIGSTPTTIFGQIHQAISECTVLLHYHVPCPHCGAYQRLTWPQFRWAKIADLDRWIAAAEKAAAAGELSYEDEGHVERLASAAHLATRIAWLRDVRVRMEAARTKAQMANIIAHGREHLVWYQCQHCSGRVFDRDKAAMIRRGRWTSDQGSVTDYWGKRHEDAEAVERWPVETRIGFQIATWYSLFMHWATIVGEFLRAEGSLKRSFNWRTERAGEPFEFRVSRLETSIFAGKAERATLPAGIVPAWGQLLLATIDTQLDHFYVVVRAWGSGERSQRVWHGKLATFGQIDELLYSRLWPTEGNKRPPRLIDRALIDSGGTEDRWLDVTRTQQVYAYVIPRQAVITAIKGASRPGPRLFWPMANPMGSGQKAAAVDLRGWMVDKHQCNDLLADLIVHGLPRKAAGASDDAAMPQQQEPEKWLLNRCPEPALQPSWEEYNAHMAAVHKAPDKPGRNMVEVWKVIHSGARIDYRDCEAYQIALARMCYVHLLLDEGQAGETPTAEEAGGQGQEDQYVERFRRR